MATNIRDNHVGPGSTQIIQLHQGTAPKKILPGSTVPFHQDKDFIGREDILEDLESRFSTTDSHNRVVLAGLGGVGKSQVAIEFSYRLRKRQPETWIFWVHASTSGRFEQAYKNIAATLELPGWDDPKTDVLSLVSRWLSNVENGRWLMIIDNADDIDVFRGVPDDGSRQGSGPLLSCIPQALTGSVLLTTRDRSAANWLSTGYDCIITINPMALDDAEQLLCVKIPDSLSTSAERIELAKELEYIPLAITQAAAYVRARLPRMSITGYLTFYRRDEASQIRLLDEERGDIRRDSTYNSVIRTWQITFDQIKRSKPEAANLLSFMAMLDRQGIPKSLLCARDSDPLDLEDTLVVLDEFSLIAIEKSGKSFEMHRLVQLATRQWLEKYHEIDWWQGEALIVLSERFPEGEFENWKTCEAILPHAREVLKYDVSLDQYMLARADLLFRLAWYNMRQRHLTVAESQSQESLVIYEHLLDGSDERTLASIAIVGQVLEKEGKYVEAEAMMRRALAGYEATRGSEHPVTLDILHNLSMVLKDQGKIVEAETMIRRTLVGYEASYESEHPDTLTAIHNLSTLLQKQGKTVEAETMTRHVLAVRERMLGLEHPHTLNSMNSLALVLGDQAKYDEAETLHISVIAGLEKALGVEHPNTLTLISNLGVLFHDQGKYDDAEPIYRRVYAGRVKALGPEHPNTLKSRAGLAACLAGQDKFEEAEILYRSVIIGMEKTLGAEHTDTLKSMNSLGVLLHDQGKYDDAEPLFRRALEGREKVLGSEHTHTLITRENLAACLELQDKSEETERSPKRTRY